MGRTRCEYAAGTMMVNGALLTNVGSWFQLPEGQSVNLSAYCRYMNEVAAFFSSSCHTKLSKASHHDAVITAVSVQGRESKLLIDVLAKPAPPAPSSETRLSSAHEHGTKPRPTQRPHDRRRLCEPQQGSAVCSETRELHTVVKQCDPWRQPRENRLALARPGDTACVRQDSAPRREWRV